MAATISRDLFDERVEEINRYFIFLEDIIEQKGVIALHINHGETEWEYKLVDKELSHTLKANSYLLLYNLVESTLNSIMDEIHETITNAGGLDINILVPELAAQALRIFKKGNAELRDLCQGSVSQSIFQEWIKEHKKLVEEDKNPLFSGNIDGKKIKAFAEIYQIKISEEDDISAMAKSLLPVKTKRNNLAHGKESFYDCGQSVGLSELKAIKNNVIGYLDHLLSAIDEYIANAGYKRQPA